MYDVLVIGKGLMGSAAARYLSRELGRVGVIGPDEPLDAATHDGLFASHYDQGRITRLLSRDLVWAELAHRSIKQYRAIEAASGIRFYEPRGCLFVSTGSAGDKYWPHIEEIGRTLPVDYERLSAGEMGTRLPFFRFPQTCRFVLENAPAGYVNPRELIEAQLAIAAGQGAALMRETVVAVSDHAGTVQVTTKEGHRYQSRKLLLATGPYSNCFDLLPRKLDLYVETEIITLAELPPSEVARLETMPAVIYQANLGELSNFYMLPPVRYPDGRFYIKMGCDTSADQRLQRYDEIQQWMSHGDSDAAMDGMQGVVLGMLPGLKVASWQTKRCLLTRTAHQKPFIDSIDGERLFVATGGNGTSAKSSDAIGQLAASLVLNGAWVDALDGALFRAQWLNGA
jgi:sarcosine oxidase